MLEFHDGLAGLGLLLLIALVLAWRWPRRYLPRPADSALDVLNRRYAHGEISGDEYTQRKHELRA